MKDSYPEFNQNESSKPKTRLYIDKTSFMGLRVVDFDVASENMQPSYGNETLFRFSP